MVFKGESERIDRESKLHANLAAYSVWRLAHLMRLKRLPAKPDDLTRARRKGTGADWKMQKAAIELLNSGVGGFDNRRPEEQGGK